MSTVNGAEAVVLLRTLSRRETANELGCSTKTVERLTARGELKGFQILPGGHWRYRRSDVMAFVTRRQAVQAQRVGVGSQKEVAAHA